MDLWREGTEHVQRVQMLQSRRSRIKCFIRVNQISNASTCFSVIFLQCIGVAPYLPRLSDSDSQNEWFSIFFLSVGAQAQVSFFLPNFDVIRTKEVEMEPVHIPCFGRGENQSF